ncbi:MAG: hypothetical protein JEZ03_07060 [Bacteroidales bacterium]|nr:hypothetical protein [Bacteroidales bacterium]
MRKLFKFFLFSLIGLLSISIFLLWYSGFFNPVYVIEKNNGPYKLVYAKVSQFEELRIKQNALFNQLSDLDITPDMTIGMYDQHENTDTFDLTGCLIQEKDFIKLNSFKDQFNIIEYESETRVVAEFAYENNFSVVAGSYRAYRALRNYAREKKYIYINPLEVYDSKNKRIYYFMKLEHKK